MLVGVLAFRILGCICLYFECVCLCFDFELEVPSGVQRKPGLLLQQFFGFICGVFVVFVGIIWCNGGVWWYHWCVKQYFDSELKIPNRLETRFVGVAVTFDCICWYFECVCQHFGCELEIQSELGQQVCCCCTDICVFVGILLVFEGVLFVFSILSVFVSIFELEILSEMYFLVFWSYFVMYSFC